MLMINPQKIHCWPLMFAFSMLGTGTFGQIEENVAHIWNEEVLEGIRNDFARPTVHARNLLHTSVAMYDIWTAYDENGTAQPFFLGSEWAGFPCPFEGIDIPSSEADRQAALHEAISYAMYRIMVHRFANSPDGDLTLANINGRMAQFGYDPNFSSMDYAADGPPAFGNYVADRIIAFGMQDGSNEQEEFAPNCYEPVNPPIEVEQFGNPDILDPDHWQAISLSVFIDQSGNPVSGTPEFVGPEWGLVVPFALDSADLDLKERDGCVYHVWHDPGDPLYFDPETGGLLDPWKWNFMMVPIWQSHHDPFDGVMIDISPAGIGTDGSYVTNPEDFEDFYNFYEGGHLTEGHAVNPVTGNPYEPNIVPRGDYARCIAEFWADGPDSETPPGHWFTLLNEIMMYADFEPRWRGQGPLVHSLEYTVKAYLALAGAMHDSAVSTWSVKGYYDYIRPVSAVRYMAELGQSSDPFLPNYNPGGMPLIEGLVELVEEGDPLAGFNNQFVGEVKIFTWQGPNYIEVPSIDQAGVDWMLAKNWWPYQRPSFVTPPFAGYVSGHSTFSRAAAEVLTLLTGTPYFPGGLGTWHMEQNQALVFEEGPSISFDLQWATYYDAANESALSRMWGGIHPPMDDGRGRAIGQQVGMDAFYCAEGYAFPEYAMGCGGTGFVPSNACTGDFNGDAVVNISDLLPFLSAVSNPWTGPYDMDNNGIIGAPDLLIFLSVFGEDCE